MFSPSRRHLRQSSSRDNDNGEQHSLTSNGSGNGAPAAPQALTALPLPPPPAALIAPPMASLHARSRSSPLLALMHRGRSDSWLEHPRSPPPPPPQQQHHATPTRRGRRQDTNIMMEGGPGSSRSMPLQLSMPTPRDALERATARRMNERLATYQRLTGEAFIPDNAGGGSEPPRPPRFGPRRLRRRKGVGILNRAANFLRRSKSTSCADPYHLIAPPAGALLDHDLPSRSTAATPPPTSLFGSSDYNNAAAAASNGGGGGVEVRLGDIQRSLKDMRAAEARYNRGLTHLGVDAITKLGELLEEAHAIVKDVRLLHAAVTNLLGGTNSIDGLAPLAPLAAAASATASSAPGVSTTLSSTPPPASTRISSAPASTFAATISASEALDDNEGDDDDDNDNSDNNDVNSAATSVYFDAIEDDI